MLLAVVGEALTGMPQHLGQQFGQRNLLRQGDVDPALRRTDRDSGEPDAHALASVEAGEAISSAADEAAERRELYLP